MQFRGLLSRSTWVAATTSFLLALVFFLGNLSQVERGIGSELAGLSINRETAKGILYWDKFDLNRAGFHIADGTHRMLMTATGLGLNETRSWLPLVIGALVILTGATCGAAFFYIGAMIFPRHCLHANVVKSGPIICEVDVHR